MEKKYKMYYFSYLMKNSSKLMVAILSYLIWKSSIYLQTIKSINDLN